MSVDAHVDLSTFPIYKFGTEAQKEAYLPACIAGEKIGAYAITEPNTGSDAAGLATRAEKTGDGYVINGRKNFITNGTICDYCLVAAYTDRSARGEGISVFIVDRDTPGFEVTRKLEKMGHRSSDTAELVFEDCRVPEEALLGGKEGAFGALMAALITGRISLGVKSAAIAEAAFDAARQYALEREAFGRPLSKLQAIRFKLAEMATRIEAAKSLAYKAAWLYSTGRPCVKEASMAKYYSAEVADYVCREAVQIHGGYGYIVEYPVERYFRDAKLASITEGTSEIQQLIIGRELGL
jgi:alkylation response protein AidB-like acyl-CoA dehydrogenase